MKRFISLLMSALMLVAVMAGCGGSGSGGSGGEQGNDASENIVTLRNTGFLTTSDPNQPPTPTSTPFSKTFMRACMI